MATVVSNQTRTKYNPKGKLVSKIVKGNSYSTTSKTYKVFGSGCFDTAPKTPRERFTDDEEWLLAGLICEGLTPQQVLVEFRKVYDTHSDHSINLQYRQAVNLSTKGAQGMSHKTNSFMNKLISLDSQTFG